MAAVALPQTAHHDVSSSSASAFAIRRASSPLEALSLFKLRLLRRRPAPPDPFDPHAAVFLLKSLSPRHSHSPRFLHAFLLKTSLLSHPHVASALLHSYSLSPSPSPSLARLLFDEIPRPNLVLFNTLLSSLSRSSAPLSSALSLFHSIPHKDLVSWCALLSACLARSRPALALSLFRRMMTSQTQSLSARLLPDPQMLVTVLSACAAASSPSVSRSVHAYAERRGMDTGSHLGTALVDSYAKSGFLKSAFRVFDRVPPARRNVMHWTAMICGLAAHGHGREAIAFFDDMRRSGVRPNEITFTGVLNACCQIGLINEGRRFFTVMAEEYGIEPGIHHYGCMVDLFAKAGRLEEAYAIIKNMRVEPNIVLWTSFLAACKKHKNFEIAEEGIERVMSMAVPDQDGGVYTLVSDLYALGGRWDDVGRVRKLMDESRVRKSRGSSFIAVDECRSSVN
ncbi:Pentatricopeptide repeat-containing protein [Ananas comosus]|uniref:Pentatricopeptide repeat-containing protein n=1 Tax=Ananas comosus TaxID=4615 RepID=A0A199VMR3_ANACO|nr:Pentatricopeptide repeat-containing protein [Ananas comosus]